MEINTTELLKLRDQIIDTLVTEAIEDYAIKDRDHWIKKYSAMSFTDLIAEYYSVGFKRGYQEAIKLYE